MSGENSATRDRAETRAARAQMQAEAAAVAWADLEKANRQRDENMARLRAMRLTKEAEAAEAARAAPPRKARKR
ncbi:hypothetical protein M446_3037 [Methylobacterium sp. 4-46]|uniref:hypothetical protein n=1 Tax=unclassified Methylobacterium TaxID=2615210 RepID=UPI000165C6FD|nr:MULTISPECIES: hypothetical protein [Methylobacterium]ACA17448.1 hypothetical protein M446_3037 [Methylobacterium sp. 4-46]WFT83133.1 hypothetical protein QA634_15410 [Methylobacterium nodulans]